MLLKNKLFINSDKTIDNQYKDYGVAIINFSKTFRKFTAVNNATILVPKGTIHGFIGPNGSGKTTTIKCLVSAMVPSKGKILIHGQNSATVEAKKHIGYIPEAARFPRRITTYDYLVSMGEVSGLSNKAAKTKTEEILRELDLWKFKKRNPNNYSSGMKKKVLLAQSLLNNPDVLILDEPAANLDPTARTELFNDLRKLKEQGKTIFISSHILSELQTLADEVTILNYSKVVYSGTVNFGEFKYEISCDNNEKLQEILEKKHYHIEFSDNKTILVNIKDDSEINKIVNLMLKAKLKIILIKPYIVDLQTMYEKIVMENNPNNHAEKKSQ